MEALQSAIGCCPPGARYCHAEAQMNRWIDTLTSAADEIKEEIKELKEENEKLKKEVKSLRCSEVSVEDHQKVCDFLNNEAEEYKKKYQEKVEENKKLKGECKENFDETHKWMGLMNGYREKWGEAQKENEDLNNTLRNAIKIIDATSSYDVDLSCDESVDNYLESFL